jgi:hypothetical protein
MRLGLRPDQPCNRCRRYLTRKPGWKPRTPLPTRAAFTGIGSGPAWVVAEKKRGAEFNRRPMSLENDAARTEVRRRLAIWIPPPR